MRKFRRGKRLTTVGLARELEAQHYVIFDVKPMHPGWVRSMTFRTLSRLSGTGKNGRIFKAIENKNYKPRKNKRIYKKKYYTEENLLPLIK